jgi:hypothetical protein
MFKEGEKASRDKRQIIIKGLKLDQWETPQQQQDYPEDGRI